MRYVVKTDRMGGKMHIRGVGLGSAGASSMEVTPRDYVSSSALPLRINMESGSENRSGLPSQIKSLLVSEEETECMYQSLSLLPTPETFAGRFSVLSHDPRC
jgi:hypothetical protein